MASTKLTALPAIAAVDLADPFYVVDASLGAAGSSQITYSNLFAEIIRDVSIHVTDAITNTLSTVATLRHSSSGTVAANFGGRLDLRLETATNVNRLAGALDFYWTIATDATRTSAIGLSVIAAAVETQVFLATPATLSLLTGTFGFTTGGALTLGIAGSVAGSLLLKGSTSGTITIKGAAAAGTYTLTLPVDDGTASQFLQTDGAGVLTWAAASTSPGGSDTQVQFNDGGAFAGAAGLTFNKTTNILTAGGYAATSGRAMAITDVNCDLLFAPYFYLRYDTTNGRTIYFTVSGTTGGFRFTGGGADARADCIFYTNASETFRIGYLGVLYQPYTYTAAATVGAQTINKPSGSINFAAAATSLVVTNSLVTTNSIVWCSILTNDATFTSCQVVPANGSFTIYAKGAPTAETRVAFWILNA